MRPRLIYRRGCLQCEVIARLVWLISWTTLELTGDRACRYPELVWKGWRMRGPVLMMMIATLGCLNVLCLAASIAFVFFR